MNRRIKIICAVSLICNVLLAGMLLGDVSRRFMMPASFDVNARLDQLPQDKRSLYESVMGPAKKQMDAYRVQIEAAKKEALNLLKAEPFDEEAYQAKVRHIDELHTVMKRDLAIAVGALAKQLTLQQRAILAEIISHPPFTMPPGALHAGNPTESEK